MSGETIFVAPRKHHVKKIRVHDYLYDSAYIVSGARDYARTAFKAAMASAQLVIQPIYKTMFTDLKTLPKMQVAYHPNCRLPDHMDRSYGAYLAKVHCAQSLPTPQLTGRDRFKFAAMPKKVLAVKSASPEFHPPSPERLPLGPARPRNRGTQSVFRESSAQTYPWQPDGHPGDGCENTPEVLYLDKFEWGPGCPYRIGDLPADFHTTEIINKMRHARSWNALVEKGTFPRWMKKTEGIIGDVETKDWIFREAEIDELQEIRLELLHQLQSKQRTKQMNRTSKKLAKMWAIKKEEMERKIDHIRRTRDREVRKLWARAAESGAGRASATGVRAARDPASELHAPLARHGYQARRRHAQIYYDPGLLSLEDHRSVSEPPEWLATCGQDLKKSCSGHHLPYDDMQLCERETKWSERFLKNLHDDLKKARLGAAVTHSAGPLHVLKPRHVIVTPRPATPEVDGVGDTEEGNHQAALHLQRILRGRAVQNLMYEGRTRAAELTEELKTTHGLQKEDRVRIAREEAKAREFTSVRNETERKEDAMTALVEELTGGAVSAALDFLEKELRRLKDERKQHAFILIALREKTMREAAEAGRRQKEEHRRREHDEMFKQVLGVAQETVDVYLREIVQEGVELASEQDAVKQAKSRADVIQQSLHDNQSMSTAEQNETVAELVQQLLLPAAQRAAARHRVAATQRARAHAAFQQIFGLVDGSERREQTCTQCGCPLDELCRCLVCPIDPAPAETEARDDPRWKHAISRPRPPEKSMGERYPPKHEMRCMLNALVDEAVSASGAHIYASESVRRDCANRIKERMEVAIDAREMVDFMIDRATGVSFPPVKETAYHHYMTRVVEDALERSQVQHKFPCAAELPSAIRSHAEAKRALEDPACHCEDSGKSKVVFGLGTMSDEDKSKLLPSELRILEEMTRCKCDTSPDPSPTPLTDDMATTDTTDNMTIVTEYVPEDEQ